MKKTLSSAISAVIAAGLVAGASPVLAYEAGDIIVRAGYANVSPRDSSDNVVVPGLGPLPGTEVKVDSGSALGLTLTYMYSNSIGIELLAATPFEHDIELDVGGAKADIGSAKHLPPTLSVVWYPMAGNSSALQPYLGLGVNYTTFFQEDVDSEVEAIVSDIAETTVKLDMELEDSWGLAAQVGVDYALTEKMHLNASIRYIDIETEAKLSMGGVGTLVKVDDVKIDPVVYQLNLGYKF